MSNVLVTLTAITIFASAVGTVGKIASWIWNKLPPVHRLKKTQEKFDQLLREEYAHVALLKCLIEEIEDVCVQETIACLKDMRVTSDLATNQVLDSLRQRLFSVISHINNEAANKQSSHNRRDEQLRCEVPV